MTSKEQQLKNSAYYLIPIVIGNLIPILTLSIFTRLLTPEEYGALALAQLYGLFVTGIANLGLIGIYGRNFFQFKTSTEGSALLFSVLSIVLLNFILLLLVTFLIEETLSVLIIGTAKYGHLLIAAYCLAGFQSLNQYYLLYLRNSEDAKTYVLYTLSIVISGTLINLLFVAILNIGIIGLVLGSLIVNILAFSRLSFKFIRKIGIHFDWSILKGSLKLSAPLTPQICFKTIGAQFDKYLIRLLSSISNVGVYNIGQKISIISFSYMTALENVFIPQTYKKMFENQPTSRETIGRYLTPFLYASVVMPLLVALFAEEVLFVLTPPAYHSAADIIIILSMYYAIQFFGKQNQLVYAKKTFILSFLTLANVMIKFVVSIPLIIKWGALGAAWGVFFSGLIFMMVYFFISQHFYRIDWQYRIIGRIYFLFFLSSFGLILLRDIELPYFFALLYKICMIAAYIYLGIRIRVITKSNILLIRGIICSN